MNKEEPIRDQAEKLRKRMKDVDSNIETIESTITSQTNEKLPPRSRIHKQRQMKKKTKLKIKYPLIRLLGMFFILLPIVIFSIYTYNQSQKTSSSELVEESKGAEAVYYTENDEEEIIEETESEESQTVQDDMTDDNSIESGENSQTGNETTIDEQVEQPQETTTPSNTGSQTESAAKPVDQTVVYHKVQPGETIFRLAMKYYKSQSGIDIIKRENSLSSNEITVGQTLTIPLSK